MNAITPQKETCGNPADEDCDGHDCIKWSILLGDFLHDTATSVAVDKMGNIFVAGSFEGEIALPGGSIIAAKSGSLFLIKLDPSGQPVWGKAFGADDPKASVLAVDSMGNVVIGGISGSPFAFEGGSMMNAGIFLAKFSNSGALSWSKGLTGKSTCNAPSIPNQLWYMRAIAITPQDDVIVGGSSCPSIDIGEGPIPNPAVITGGFIVKLRGSDGSGKVADGSWGKAFGSGNYSEAAAVTVDSSGSIFASGIFSGDIVISPGFSMKSTAGGGGDIFLVKLDADGALAKIVPSNAPWQMQVGADMATYLRTGAISLSPSGGPIIAGAFSGTVNFGGSTVTAPGEYGFVVQYGPNMEYGWRKAFNGAVGGMVADTDGSILVTGGFMGVSNLGAPPLESVGKADVFVAKLSSAGINLWSRQYGGSESDNGTAIALTSTGDPVIVGTTDGSINFGAGLLASAGDTDLFVAKLSP